MDARPGKWYLFAYCQREACGMSWAFLETPSPPDPIEIPETLELTCPYCGYSGVYNQQEVVRGQIK